MLFWLKVSKTFAPKWSLTLHFKIFDTSPNVHLLSPLSSPGHANHERSSWMCFSPWGCRNPAEGGGTVGTKSSLSMWTVYISDSLFCEWWLGLWTDLLLTWLKSTWASTYAAKAGFPTCPLIILAYFKGRQENDCECPYTWHSIGYSLKGNVRDEQREVHTVQQRQGTT